MPDDDDAPFFFGLPSDDTPPFSFGFSPRDKRDLNLSAKSTASEVFFTLFDIFQMLWPV